MTARTEISFGHRRATDFRTVSKDSLRTPAGCQGAYTIPTFAMIPRYRTLLVTFLLLPVTIAAAQTPEAEVRAVIDQLFDGMRTGDSTAVRAVFHEHAVLATTFTTPEGVPVYRTNEADRFVEAVGSPHDEVWDEKIWDVVIQVDDNLASAWMNYAFYAGDNFSHCGVNSFQMVRTPDGWKTVYLVDTRRRDGCDKPMEE